MINFINSSIELYNIIYNIYNGTKIKPNLIHIKLNNLMNRCYSLANELNETLTRNQKGTNWLAINYNLILLEEVFNFSEVIKETHIKEYVDSNILKLTANTLGCNIIRLANEFRISTDNLEEPIELGENGE